MKILSEINKIGVTFHSLKYFMVELIKEIFMHFLEEKENEEEDSIKLKLFSIYFQFISIIINLQFKNIFRDKFEGRIGQHELLLLNFKKAIEILNLQRKII